VNLGLDTSILMIIIGTFVLIGLTPLGGIDKETSISYEGESYKVSFVDSQSLSSSGYQGGGYDPVTNDIRIATGGFNGGFLPFMTNCNHEVRHLKFTVGNIDRQDKISYEEQHERMEGLGHSMWPWNWQKQCVNLLDDRFLRW
jgi:hypothetical protein